MFSYHLNEYGLIRISGNDAEKFLQGQLTCDVREVNEQQTRLGAHCNAQGRVQFCFRLFKHQEYYYFRIIKSLIPIALTLLQKYAVFSKVKLEDASHELAVCGLCAITPIDFLSSLTIDQISQHKNNLFIRVPGLTTRFEIIVAADKINDLKNQLPTAFKPADVSQWQLEDIRAGIANIFPETCGLFTPHDINYPQINGVSFNKGCYTGQEIVARMHFLGKLKQHMYRVQLINNPIAPQPGLGVINQDGHHLGTLVIAAPVNNNQPWEALVVLTDKGLNEPIFLENSNKTMLQVLDLPYTL